MDNKLINHLNKLNIDFYNVTATEFDDSRQYFWQGWKKIPPLLDSYRNIRVADIGCGNGRFGQFLNESCLNLKLSYTGIDANKQLLNIAKKNLQGKIPALHLYEFNVVDSILKNEDFLFNKKFELITIFGVLHHIPSFELRLKLLQYLLSKLTTNGFVIVSIWQFMNYERFRKKIIANKYQLETNDFILDWKRGTHALRYCHFIDDKELEKLIKQSGAQLIKSYNADGKEGNVNNYVVLSNKS